ncbi:MAG TPA: HEPN domain-containing protein [Candidatus Nanopelagicaceae bacterium]|nr:HEPN domain-containing protein [Candidatus Nanopelagicaceae bacterium]
MSKKSNNWLEEADWDLENAKILLKNKRFNTVVFHSQQAAEKAVKALLYFNKSNGWGHSIYSLLEKYKEITHANIDDLQKSALSLDKHYITTRYPDALPDLAPHKAYTIEEAENAITLAQKIISYVKIEIEKGN